MNNGKDNLSKFDAKVDEGIFQGYSSQSHAYRAYNKRTMLIKETVHITFDETNQRLQEALKLATGYEEINEFQRLTITIEQHRKANSAKFREVEIIGN